MGIIITSQTIRNNLHNANIRGRTPRKKKQKKKHISMKQIGRKDLRLPKRMSENQQSSGKRHFSEERNIFGSDGRKKVWKKPSTSLKTKKN